MIGRSARAAKGTGDGLASGISAALTAAVSEKTGYPPESLDPDMDLEADLGIDSIKRVEILSAIQEKLPAAPKVKPKPAHTPIAKTKPAAARREKKKRP